LGQFLRAILDHRIYANHLFSLRIDSAAASRMAGYLDTSA